MDFAKRLSHQDAAKAVAVGRGIPFRATNIGGCGDPKWMPNNHNGVYPQVHFAV